MSHHDGRAVGSRVMFIGRTAAGPQHAQRCPRVVLRRGSRYGHTPSREGHAYPVPTGETMGCESDALARLDVVQHELSHEGLAYTPVVGESGQWLAGAGGLGCGSVLVCSSWWAAACSRDIAGV